MEDDRKLVESYREAWAEFERRLRMMQAAPAANPADTERLVLDVEDARLKYGLARDRLVARMLDLDITDIRPGSQDARIRGSANLLWEFAGKPGNSAEKDWLRAEALVRSASAPAR
ncbi:MAG TPA: DUF2934 domain-containing protein [Bryobacteraceae bacterium]|jgi:hypothetical protein|nr:DUF2934 domain-containing protein [Bryobacteraceae bacterium]